MVRLKRLYLLDADTATNNSRLNTDQSHQDEIFFVTDRVAQVDLEIEHFPTERMWYIILTKPLQGRSFREFRLELMN